MELVQCEILWFASAFVVVVLCLWDVLAYICAPWHFVLLVHVRCLLATTIGLHRKATTTPPLSSCGRRLRGLTRIPVRKAVSTSNIRVSSSSAPADCPRPEASGVQLSPVQRCRHYSKSWLRSRKPRHRQLRFKKLNVWRMYDDRRPSIRPSNIASGLMCLSLISVCAWGIPARIKLPQHQGHPHLDATDSTFAARYDEFG